MAHSQIFVTFLVEVPGAENPREIDKPVANESISGLVFQKDCFAFYFWKRSLAGFSNALPAQNNEGDYSVYFIGERYNIEQLRQDPSNQERVRLADKMESEGWAELVYCPHVGIWQKLNEGDMVIPLDKITFAA